MRPTLDKMLEGMNYVLLNDIFPELSSLYAQTQAMMLSATIGMSAAIWQGTCQFPLIEENKDLRDVLLAATKALKATEKDYTDESLERLTQKIDAELEKGHPSEEEYPSLQSLLEENCNLKELLDQTIIALDETSRDYKCQALDEVRGNIRAHLRKHLNWRLLLLAASRGA